MQPSNRGLAQAAVRALAERTAGIRRHRQARGMTPSEKLGGAATWTTVAQRDAMFLLEVQHAVASYGAWPTPVTLAFPPAEVEYHPTLGATLADGRHLVIDLVNHEDEGSPARRGLEEMLGQALAARGDVFVPIAERALRADRRVANARAVLRACGWPVSPAQEFSLVRLVADLGGEVTLGQLSAAGEEGPGLRAAACVLVMRRVLAIDVGGPTPEECAVRLLRRAA